MVAILYDASRFLYRQFSPRGCWGRGKCKSFIPLWLLFYFLLLPVPLLFPRLQFELRWREENRNRVDAYGPLLGWLKVGYIFTRPSWCFYFRIICALSCSESRKTTRSRARKFSSLTLPSTPSAAIRKGKGYSKACSTHNSRITKKRDVYSFRRTEKRILPSYSHPRTTDNIRCSENHPTKVVLFSLLEIYTNRRLVSTKLWFTIK